MKSTRRLRKVAASPRSGGRIATRAQSTPRLVRPSRQAPTRIERIGSQIRLDELAPEWERLADGHGLPFLRHAWFAAWWAAFGRGRLQVYVLWDGDELAAVFPLQVRGHRLRPLANEHTPFVGPLGRSPQALAVLMQSILDEWGSLSLAPVFRDVPATGQLLDTLGRGSRWAYVEEKGGSPVVRTSGSLAEYMAQLSGNARRDFRRLRRLLAGVPDVEIAALVEPEDLERELSDGFAIEGSHWKTRRGTAILDSAATTTFYRDVAARFAALGKLRLSRLSFGDRPAAFNLNLLDGGRVWGLKGGYDPAYARFAPGMLLLLAEIERCFELGLDALELLGSEDPWKRKFTRAAHPVVQVHAYSFGTLPLFTYGYRRLVRPRLRAVYRRLPRSAHR